MLKNSALFFCHIKVFGRYLLMGKEIGKYEGEDWREYQK